MVSYIIPSWERISVDYYRYNEEDDFEDFDMGDNSFDNTQVASGDDIPAGLDDLDDITNNDTNNILPGMDFEDNTLETTDDRFGGLDTNIETNNKGYISYPEREGWNIAFCISPNVNRLFTGCLLNVQ